ncbi:MAG: right-handed parallel beta-helix repeat-containing protein, partial [Bacteroidales bacterium]|nr:right-handed parallel beta-helix repeat-containing protein [Bacteroidales bacterium]
MKGLLVYISLVLISLIVTSQTIIPGGEVYGTWHASQSPFHVQGDIVIEFDSTLIIEPGVEVYFDDSYKLTVNGRLDATGTETDSILFTATDPTVGWQGIEFYQTNAGLGVSNLQYCILTHGKKNSGSGGAIYVYQSDNVLINHCRIENNYAYEGGGIFIDDGWIDVKNCMIRYNSAKYYAGGITCLSSEPYFYNIMISDNTCADAGGMFFAYNPVNSYPLLENLTVI